MAKRFTAEEIAILSKNPNVKHVREDRLDITFEFRERLYEYWKEHNGNIRPFLTENNFDCKMLGKGWINDQRHSFQRNGYPTYGKNKKFGVYEEIIHKNTDEEISFLSSTNVLEKSGNGVAFSQSFINEMHSKMPDVDIRKELIARNIDPVIIGYQRIHKLELLLYGELVKPKKTHYDETIVHSLKTNPYVKCITSNRFALKDAFYIRCRSLSDVHINKLLQTFEIDPDLIPIHTRNKISNQLKNHSDQYTDSDVYGDINQLIRIEKNLFDLLMDKLNASFSIVKANISSYDPFQRKAVCEWIRNIHDHDDYHLFTLTSLLQRVGISKSNYYAILKNPGYGSNYQKKQDEDEKDIVIIKRVLAAYKNRPKGTRMVTMMLPRLEHIKMNRKKVQRLMRKADLLCKVRTSNVNRQKGQELLKRNCKPNLLKRRFRLFRPNTSELTDVSYLKYGNNQTSYLSPVKDSSSGMILAYDVSDSNDLAMTERMLRQLENISFQEDALFHSDQGALYLTNVFQNRIKALGFQESMSRRGNCWDNASQESFFGHMKDECDYSHCKNNDEVKDVIDDYIYYYNEERPQWNRNKMTPHEFQDYLDEMSDEEFEEYRQKEEKKYQAMMAKSVEKAIKRARDLGADI